VKQRGEAIVGGYPLRVHINVDVLADAAVIRLNRDVAAA
jgi:hypothetical protein